jgi:hypothetical protein
MWREIHNLALPRIEPWFTGCPARSPVILAPNITTMSFESRNTSSPLIACSHHPFHICLVNLFQIALFSNTCNLRCSLKITTRFTTTQNKQKFILWFSGKTPYSVVDGFQWFGGLWCFNDQTGSSETFVITYKTIRCHISEHHNMVSTIGLLLLRLRDVVAFWKGPCHSSGGKSPVSHCGGPGSSPDQVMWWTKWFWDRFSTSTSVSHANSHSTDCSTFIISHPGLVP